MISTPSGLELSRYQQLAQLTDHLPRLADEGVDPRLGPLLGLAGEVGTLMAGYKKHLRGSLVGCRCRERWGRWWL